MSCGKITDSILKDCSKELKSYLNEEVIDYLWLNDWITTEEKAQIESNSNPLKRKEKLINILLAK